MRHHVRFEGARLTMAMAMVAAIVCATIGGIVRAPVARACPSTADCATNNFPYSHSWYVTDLSTNAIKAIAQQDATWSSNTCANNPQIGNVDFLTILDFGRPGTHNGVYSVYDFGTWQTYAAVTQAALLYADTWFNDTTPCPRLHLAIGTANDYECYDGVYISSCSVYSAGQQWDKIAHAVEAELVVQGYAWQETVWTADDLEGSFDQWTNCSSCNPKTVDFVNGMANQESTYSTHANMVDYGDAGFGQGNIEGGPVWTPQNTYDAAWGLGWDIPVAELYVSGQLTPWLCVYFNNCPAGHINEGQGQLHFYGAQAQCSEADTLPNGNCWVQRSGQCQWSPYEAYTNLTSPGSGTGDNSVPYADNIRWQQDQPTVHSCP